MRPWLSGVWSTVATWSLVGAPAEIAGRIASHVWRHRPGGANHLVLPSCCRRMPAPVSLVRAWSAAELARSVSLRGHVDPQGAGLLTFPLGTSPPHRPTHAVAPSASPAAPSAVAFELLESKLLPPRRRGGSVPRASLIDRVEDPG